MELINQPDRRSIVRPAVASIITVIMVAMGSYTLTHMVWPVQSDHAILSQQ